ncbi:hypothetical protein M0805_000646 [Coniferiporia weirii]|nr:hypothetical protein M0805_000646 [Coniferiporia weirii]
MADLRSYPIFYPPDGLYYVYSKDYGHFWRQRGVQADGGLIDCEVLGQTKEGASSDNRIWKLTTTAPPTGKLGPRVTLQSVQSIQGSDPVEAAGYVAKKSGKIVQTTKKTAWTLVGHTSKPFSFKIVTSDLRVSINAPTSALFHRKTELRAEFHVTSAYDMRVYDPQWWYFVPVAQVDKFLVENGIKRAG